MMRCTGPLAAAMSSALLAVTALAAPQGQLEQLEAKAKSLLTQLENGPTNTARLSAEWDLLKLGPDILPFLALPENSPPSLKDRIAGIRTTLEDLRPRIWKLTETRTMPLAEAADLLKKSTGLALADLRQGNKISEVTVEAGASSYWQVVESLAKQSNSRISLYQPDGQVALMDGPTSKEPADLRGLFRIAVKRIASRLDFEGQTHTGSLGLEIAWEPRFSPYLIEVGKLSFRCENSSNGPTNQTIVPAASPVFVTEKSAKEFDVFFSSPARTAASIRDLSGQFIVTMPAKSLKFVFKTPKQGDKQAQDGVQLTVNEITVEKERWTVGLTVEVPEAGPMLDSYQTWLGSRAWLSQSSCEFERGAGENREVVRANPLYTQTTKLTSTRVAVRYQFTPPANAGEFGAWRLMCHVPGRLVEVTAPFEFAKIQLP
jgi:hypothetical protein